ncbi:hypothetical protein PVK06_003143 [Gossypium arboreum]|uniref:Uncharacterized protein n=1 Tax=Gossypium arboreum TaxID=29729 RepID=A0ABR0R6Q5_GOSAR|nr:hypothetical protein PVK06_003143 [Gossypium arboreum]
MIENNSQNNVFQYGNWLRVPIEATNQNNGLWRNGIEMFKEDEEGTRKQYRNTSVVLGSKGLKDQEEMRLVKDRDDESETNGFGWQVGDGKSINIRDDKLGIKGLNGSSLDSNMITPSVNRVSDL